MTQNKTENLGPSKARTADALDKMNLNRRSFLTSSSAVALGATLGAWVPRGAFAQTDSVLEIMAWEGYTLEPETAAWRESKGVTMRAALMSNQDDVTAKLVGSNAVRLDASEYSNGYNDIYKGLDLLTKLDITKIPNFNKDDIYPPFFEGEMWHWDGEYWAVPWVWGVDTIVIHPDLAGTEVKKHSDLLKPEFAGKLAFFDNPLTTWPQMAKVAGYGDKFPNLTHEEMDDCFAKMIPYRDQTKIFATSSGDIVSLFVSGEIAACFCVWAAIPLETAKQGVTTLAIMPEEGAAVWADAWFIPKTAVNIDLAHEFINQALTPEIQASISKTAAASAVSRKAPALMDEATRSLFDYDNFDSAFASIKIYGQPPRTSEEFATYDDWLQKWADFRAGF